MNILKSFFTALLLVSAFPAFSQKKLVEGSITYKATMKNIDGTTKEGTYIVYVKNKQIRKEIKIGTDFENVVICDNTDKLYSLKSMDGRNFAVEMTPEDYQKRNEKYTAPVIKDGGENRVISGQKTQKATVSYKDGNSTNVFYTKDWITDAPYLFERFQGLEGLPLAFDYKNEQGAVINFEAIKFDEEVVENSKFKVPAGYKVISNDEYRKLRSK
jgi:hypothetical protein